MSNLTNYHSVFFNSLSSYDSVKKLPYLFMIYRFFISKFGMAVFNLFKRANSANGGMTTKKASQKISFNNAFGPVVFKGN